MTKVVYNNCFGGFGLSNEAMRRYFEIKGITVYPETSDGYFKTETYYLTPKTGDDKVDNNRESVWYWDIERDDPVLVQVVEELGDKANAKYANLVVEDIPAGTRYRIEEYDGNEHIEYADSVNWSIG